MLEETTPLKDLYNSDFHRLHVSDEYQWEADFGYYLTKYFKLTSVLDIGCGVGRWISGAKNAGCTEVKGLEFGYAHAEPFVFENVKSSVSFGDASKTMELGRKYDCAWSFEVAEHVPAEFAPTFVKNLNEHAERWVLFSAAYPGQGGRGHINEQPKEYWINLFSADKNLVYRPDVAEDLIRANRYLKLGVFSYLEKNLLVFEKTRKDQPTFKIPKAFHNTSGLPSTLYWYFNTALRVVSLKSSLTKKFKNRAKN